MHFKKALIIAGLPGSGKSLAAEFLYSEGWQIVSAGDTIREMCRKEGMDQSRLTLQEYGANLLKEKGHEYFSDALIAKAINERPVVFEGIRPPEVIKILKEKIHGKVIYIEASNQNRFNRLKHRDNINTNSFQDLNSNNIETQVCQVKEMANYIINNNSTKYDFKSKLLEICKKI